MSVVVESHGPVAAVLLARPERRNALSTELLDALGRTLDTLEADPAVRVVVLSGQGKAFSAGGDLQGGLSGDGLLAGHGERRRYADLLLGFRRRRFPILGAAQGDAFGGGLGLLAACDLAYADPGARLGTPEVKIGLFPWMILAVLQRDVPRKALLELLLTGGHWTAEEACRLGLLNRVSAPGRVLDEALEVARLLADRPPGVVALGKRAFHATADLALEPALEHLHSLLSLNLLTEDAAEGISAFLQKRAPQWTGR